MSDERTNSRSRSLEALKSLGSSTATKFVIPVELTGILQGMAGQAGRAFGNGRGQT